MNAATASRLPATKGEETRAAILDAAVRMASESGFESLTIGALAERTGLSKSGLFAHFGSKLELQIATLDEASRRFTQEVYMPALKVPRGLRRLRAVFEAWMHWTERASLPGGCPMDSATQEYDHRPGPMRDAVMERQRQGGRELAKTVHLAVEAGELKPDTDVKQFAFDLTGLILAYYRWNMVVGREEAHKRAVIAFERLVKDNQA